MVEQKQQRQVHFERLHTGGSHPFWVRALAWWLCHLAVGLAHLFTSLLERLRGAFPGRIPDEKARVVLTGTFFADNWVEAHVRPLAESSRCEHVWVVSDYPFVPIENATYVCAPRWLQRLIGRVPARSLVFVITAARWRANVVGGFHLLLNGLLALMVARLLRARAIYYCVGGWAEFVNGGVHGGNLLFTMISRDDKDLERSLLRAVRRFDLILTMGTGARDFLIQRCGVRIPVEVMPGGIDSTRYQPGGNATKTYDLVTISRLASVKRLDVFLDVVHRVSDSVPTVTAAIVGDGGEMDSLVHKAAELGLSDRVSFVGRQADVERWLADSRLFVLTSDSEGLSLALMEAAMAGLPAVVSDVGDLGDLVEEGVTGWRPEPRDVESFAGRIVALLSDVDKYEEFSTATRRSAMQHTVPAARDHWDRALARFGFEARVPQPAAEKHSFRTHLASRKRMWELGRQITRHPVARTLGWVPPSVWLGKKFRRTLKLVRQSDHWSKDQIADYQLRELRRIVSHAYERSSYYRKVLRECGFEPGDLRCLDDLAHLPTLDADTVRKNLISICTTYPKTDTVDYVSTGGTGGQPMRFYIGTDRSASEFAYLVAGWGRAGYELGMTLAVFRGRVVAEARSGLRHTYDPILRQHYYSSFHLTDESMQRYMQHLARIGPCFLHVYPSSVAILARFLRRRGLAAPPNVRGIIAESEIVYPSQRSMVKEVFNCRYFSLYGHSEKVVAGAECESSTHCHVSPTYGCFELLDEQGAPVRTAGERGEIVGTGFINYVMPFIRYRTGDFATYVGEECGACGRRHTVITDVRGHRTQETLVAKDGSYVSWVALNMHDDTFDNVVQFQFLQEQAGVATLRVVPGPAFGEQDRRRIASRLESRLDNRLEIRISLCDTVPLSERGKAKYVDQRLPVVSAESEQPWAP